MSLKFFIAGIILTTILAFGSFALIIFLFSPDSAGAVLLLLLFLSLFFGLAGLVSLLGFYIRWKRNKERGSFDSVGISFRQGTLLAFLIAGSLFLLAFRIGWWASLILLALVVSVEILFLRTRQ